ncbi:MAG TPA: DUF296 domain-containing protein [Bacillota bacterium]|jgi:predicted DNA-binding protein with PD1-like motif|nr:DUF296 domain-containing protein [Bacillota bacterium]HOL09122.1 DUF296 domain-containing protein [Bacillota bacterium]HPO97179.1 DUF296 domain-containing protein [Bacillota bacterium]
MKYTEAAIGRVFIFRLEHGDRIPNVIEKFATDHNINMASVLFLGGADTGSKIVVGPADGNSPHPVPMVTALKGTSEAVGVGTLIRNESNIPKLHLHAAFGREEHTTSGCTREGVLIWQIGEVIITELLPQKLTTRKINPATSFELLEIEPDSNTN